MIKLLYFAALVDKLGLASEQIELPSNVNDVRGLVAQLKQRGGAWEEVFSNDALRITVNKQFSELAAPIKSGDEVAFISAWL
ncbi:MAG: MoaD/ThiS family protein [Burkholderiales bacterium]|nr:MoaD/ThiS family protein [Burkholderiales bacterium]